MSQIVVIQCDQCGEDIQPDNGGYRIILPSDAQTASPVDLCSIACIVAFLRSIS